MAEKHVLTLIANSSLDEALIGAVHQSMLSAGAKIVGSEWLAPATAHDTLFMAASTEEVEQSACAALGDSPVDMVMQEAGNRKKRLLITDMDSTIITIECIDEIADFAGLKPKIAAITERAMRGEIDFKDALAERVGLLKGLPESVLQRVYDERLKLMPGAKALVQTMRANGAYTVLVSGGFTYFTSRIREEVGFDTDYSNQLEIADGKLTGKVLPPILDKNSKLETLLSTCQQRGISLSDTMTVGDGANDLPMLMAAGLGVAYHAKPIVQQSTRARLNHTDLSALLYVQGYKESDIRQSA